MEIKNEIISDYEEYCKNKLKNEFGSSYIEKDDSIYNYQRFKCRIIDVRPRLVIEPNNLIVPKKYKNAYENIKNDILCGHPLKKYQSKRLKSLTFNDDMLSHWKIQHFHLGETLESDGFIKRTGDLLFLYFTNNEAFIVGFFNHDSWCDLDIIETLHINWPELLLKFKKKEDKSSLSPKKLTSEEHAILRKKRYSTYIIVNDGTEYLAPGLGVTGNGVSIEVNINSMQVIHMLNNDFQIIVDNIDQILASDPFSRTTSIVTIGMEMDEVNKRFIFKIKETGFLFSLSS
ncbi:hypothetical protein [Acinetobacter junii]|uniref:hypothetical protein n=1 Tax=Acinetobacter junii TaxID=40215 RepID=UPI003A8AD629